MEEKNMNITQIYNEIVADKEIVNIYSEIEKEEDNDKEHGWAYHNYNHALNVSKIVECILNNLNFDYEFIFKAKIAAILHDVGALHGKDNHAEKSFKYTQDYFRRKSINFDGIEQVLNAIRIHNNGFTTDDVMGLTLILADKIDIAKTRVTNNGKKVKGMRQLLFINDIIFKIENKCLIVNFIVDKNININELNEFYFTSKVFKAIESFSIKTSLNYKILMNNSLWVLNNKS